MTQKLFQHKSGLLFREDSSDVGIWSEIKREYGWMPVENKNVLDIGGCFGGYTYLAMLNNAEEVWCFEPEPNNYETILKNVQSAKHINKKTKVEVFNQAITTDIDKVIPFYLTTSGKNLGNFSTSKYQGRKKILVKTKNFANILNVFRPQVIKMDCEGQEFDLLKYPLPNFVKYITVEIHFISPASMKPTWFEQTKKILKQFEKWKTIKQPKLSSTLWHTIGAWSR